MRVTPTTTQSSGPTRKKPAGGGSTFRVSDGTQTAAASAAAPAPAMAPLDSLIALQEQDGEPQARKRAVRRASDMLDMLEGIRLDLLGGVLPASRLTSLVALVKSRRDSIHDPRLAHVLDEIELRARVELAKAGHIL